MQETYPDGLCCSNPDCVLRGVYWAENVQENGIVPLRITSQGSGERIEGGAKRVRWRCATCRKEIGGPRARRLEDARDSQIAAAGVLFAVMRDYRSIGGSKVTRSGGNPPLVGLSHTAVEGAIQYLRSLGHEGIVQFLREHRDRATEHCEEERMLSNDQVARVLLGEREDAPPTRTEVRQTRKAVIKAYREVNEQYRLLHADRGKSRKWEMSSLYENMSAGPSGSMKVGKLRIVQVAQKTGNSRPLK